MVANTTNITNTQDLGALLTLAAQGAATLTSADQANSGARGVKVVVDITAVGGTPTLVVTIQGKDPASGKVYTMLASAALATTGTTVMTILPGLIAAANLIASDALPAVWNVKAVIAGVTPSITATIGASTLM